MSNPYMDIRSNRLSYTYFDENKNSKKFKKLLGGKRLNKEVENELKSTSLSLDTALLSGLQSALDFKASDAYARRKRGVDLLKLRADMYEVKIAETIEQSYEAIKSEIKAGDATAVEQQPLYANGKSSKSIQAANSAGKKPLKYLDEVESVTKYYDVFREKDYFFRNIRASTLHNKLSSENIHDQDDAPDVANIVIPSPLTSTPPLADATNEDAIKDTTDSPPCSIGGSYKPSSWSEYSIIDAKTTLLELNSKHFTASDFNDSAYYAGHSDREFGLGLELGLDNNAAIDGNQGSWFWSKNLPDSINDNGDDDNDDNDDDKIGHGDRSSGNGQHSRHTSTNSSFSALWTDTLLFTGQSDAKAEMAVLLSEAEQEYKERLIIEEEERERKRARAAAQLAAEKERERLRQAALFSSASYDGGDDAAAAGDLASVCSNDASIDASPTLGKQMNLAALSFIGGGGVDNDSDLKPYAVISHLYISCCSVMREAIDECYYSFVNDPVSYGVDTLRVGNKKLALLTNTFNYAVDNNTNAKNCYKEFQQFISMQRLYYANEVTDRLKQISEMQSEYNDRYNTAADEFEAYQNKHRTIELETAKHVTSSDKMDSIKKEADSAIAKLGRELKEIQEKEAYAVMKFKEWDHVITEIVKKWRKKYLKNIENVKLIIKRVDGILKETAARIIQKSARQKFLLYFRKEIYAMWNEVYESRRQRVERLVERKMVALKTANDWAIKKTPVTTAITLPKLNFRKGLK